MDVYIVRWGYPPTYTWAGPPGDRCGTPMLAVSIGHRADFGSVHGYESKPWYTRYLKMDEIAGEWMFIPSNVGMQVYPLVN